MYLKNSPSDTLTCSQLMSFSCSADLQYGAISVVVECYHSDDGVWKDRLEHRSKLEAGSSSSHKPQTWGDVQKLLAR